VDGQSPCVSNDFSVDQGKKSLPAIIQNARLPLPKIHHTRRRNFQQQAGTWGGWLGLFGAEKGVAEQEERAEDPDEGAECGQAKKLGAKERKVKTRSLKTEGCGAPRVAAPPARR